jgi:hypothetical protein
VTYRGAKLVSRYNDLFEIKLMRNIVRSLELNARYLTELLLSAKIPNTPSRRTSPSTQRPKCNANSAAGTVSESLAENGATRASSKSIPGLSHAHRKHRLLRRRQSTRY